MSVEHFPALQANSSAEQIELQPCPHCFAKIVVEAQGSNCHSIYVAMVNKTVNIQKSLSTMERIPKNPELFM